MMGCGFVLPFRERVGIISQEYFGFGVMVIVGPTKDRVKCEFSSE